MVVPFRPVILNDGRAAELAAVRLIGRISCVTGLCHVVSSALRKSPQKGNRDEHFDQREYDRATRVHWTIPTYLSNSSSTRNKLLTACVQSPMVEEEKWQRENNRASECRSPKKSSNPIQNRRKRSENEQQALNAKDCSMNSRCVQAAITRLLKEQKINPG
jgi:hypothetical protein